MLWRCLLARAHMCVCHEKWWDNRDSRRNLLKEKLGLKLVFIIIYPSTLLLPYSLFSFAQFLQNCTKNWRSLPPSLNMALFGSLDNSSWLESTMRVFPEPWWMDGVGERSITSFRHWVSQVQNFLVMMHNRHTHTPHVSCSTYKRSCNACTRRSDFDWH